MSSIEAAEFISEVLDGLIDTGQVTCLLGIATLEGQGTPFWFIEKLWPDEPDDHKPESASAVHALAERQPLYEQLQGQISPLSRYLLKTCVLLDTCRRSYSPLPLAKADHPWLLRRVAALDQAVREATAITTAGNANSLHIVGQLVHLLLVLREPLAHLLQGRVDETLRREVVDSIHAVHTLYQAVGHASPEQRDVLDGELQRMAQIVSGIEEQLRP